MIAKFHPILVHFPIAWLILCLLCDVIAISRRDHERKAQWARNGFYLLILATIATAAAIVSGWLRFQQWEGEPDPLLLRHRTTALVTGGGVLMSFLLRYWNPLFSSKRWTMMYFAIFVATTLFLIATAHFGGMVSFGEDYLF